MKIINVSLLWQLKNNPFLTTITIGSSPLQSSKRLLETPDGEKRAEKKLLPSISASYIIESLQQIQSTCHQAKTKHTSAMDTIADLIYSMEMEGGCLWKIQEQILKISNELMRIHAHLEARISQVQQTQDKILTLLEGSFSVRKEEDASTLHHIVPEIRSVANKLCAMSKVQSSSITDIRATTNKLNAMIKCHFEKSAPKGDVNNM